MTPADHGIRAARDDARRDAEDNMGGTITIEMSDGDLLDGPVPSRDAINTLCAEIARRVHSEYPEAFACVRVHEGQSGGGTVVRVDGHVLRDHGRIADIAEEAWQDWAADVEAMA